MGPTPRLVEIEEDEFGRRIRAGAHDLVAIDQIAGRKRPHGAAKVARDVIVGEGGRADVFLRPGFPDAGREETKPNQDRSPMAQLRKAL